MSINLIVAFVTIYEHADRVYKRASELNVKKFE